MGRPISHRERHRRLLRRSPPGTNVSHLDEPLYDDSAPMALDGLHGLHRRRRARWVRNPAVPHWSVSLKVRHRVFTAVVSIYYRPPSGVLKS